MAILGGIGLVTGAVQGVSSLFGSSDPTKDAERVAAVDRVFQDALMEGKGSRPYIQLACWAGAATGSPDYQQALAYGQVQPGQACRIGSDYALGYAKTKYAELQSRLAAGPAIAASGIALTSAANQVAPGSVQTVIAGAIGGAVGGIPNLVLIGAVAVGAWLLLRKR